MQNLVFAVYFSIIRLRAICAAEVIASASSRIISLNAPNPSFVVADVCCVEALKICLVLANVLICSRTTSIPRSSEAFSSKTICRIFFGPYICRARARIVEVLPVPGGPYNSKCGSRLCSTKRLIVDMMS